MRRGLAALAVLSLIGFASISSAEPLTIVGKGRAEIIENRRLDARGQAMSKALHNALDKAVAKILDVDSGDLGDDELEKIDAMLGSSITEYILDRKVILDEASGSEYRIEVRVGFDRDRLNAAMLRHGISQRASGHFWERIMVVITEDHRLAQSSAQTQMVRYFVEAGYRVVDQAQIETIRGLDQGAALARGDVNAAVMIGRKFDAEIVILGDAIVQRIPETHAGVSRRASINAKMLRTDNAQIMATNEIARSGVDQTPELAARKAFATASEALAQYFLDQLDKLSDLERKKPRTIETVINGISYARYVMLKDAIDQGIGGVKKYHARDYDERALRAEVDMEFTGKAENLADAMALHRFEDFRLTVTKVTPNRIDLRVAPR